MKSIRIIFALAVATLTLNTNCWAQNNVQKSDDLGRIVLNVHIESNTNIPSYAKSVLTNKLTQMATKNGVAGKSLDQRFVITANIVEMSRDITATTPAMIALTIAPTIYIGDAISGELYASCELPTVKGVGENETKAYVSAVKGINVNNPQIAECIQTGKERIIAYYNSQIDFIIAEADALTKSGKYDEAMFKLAAVPNVCKDAYTKAMGKMGNIYQQKIDKEGNQLYNEAYAQWNAVKSDESAQKAVNLLAQIDPLSSAAPKGQSLVDSIGEYYAKLDQREWDFMMKQYNDEQKYKNRQLGYEHEENMAQIKSEEAASKAALEAVKETVALTNNRVEYYYVGWY